MIQHMLSLLRSQFALEEIPLGGQSIQKVRPATFRIRQFRIEGVGNLSIMEGRAMLGLMQMDTVILTPGEVDAPLYSYDRIHVMGKDTLIQEFYDTFLDGACREKLGALDTRKEMIADIPEHDLGKHWYDPIKLPQSVSKRGTKCTAQADAYVLAVFRDYLELLQTLPHCDPREKCRKSEEYVTGLFENGGPSTDAFVKALGKEPARELFRRVIFGIEQ